MKHEDPNIALLPAGFVDLMPEEAEAESWAINTLMDIFKGYGYKRIKPPMMEFEDSLLAQGPGAAIAQDTFRLMDPLSNRMMGLRADITPQIARIVCTRFSDDNDRPIRLAYANDVVRTRAGQMRGARQFTQVGCEIIRDDSAASYTEALMLIVLGLRALGVENITIDLSIPRTLDALIKDMNLSGDDENALRDAVSKRDVDGIKAFNNDAFDVIVELLRASGKAGGAITQALSLTLPPTIKAELDKLQNVYDNVVQNLKDLEIPDVSLTFDPFETMGFDYQSGIAFTVFSKSIRGELGRGGYYDVRFGAEQYSRSERAIGFTLYMDTIRPGVKNIAASKVIAVTKDASWKEIEALRGDDFKVLRVSDLSQLDEDCTHIYKNAKPEKR